MAVRARMAERKVGGRLKTSNSSIPFHHSIPMFHSTDSRQPPSPLQLPAYVNIAGATCNIYSYFLQIPEKEVSQKRNKGELEYLPVAFPWIVWKNTFTVTPTGNWPSNTCTTNTACSPSDTLVSLLPNPISTSAIGRCMYG